MIYRHDNGLTEFAFFRPAARSIHLAGDFNAWSTHSLPLHRDHDGWWRGRLNLPTGEYRFRYLVDNQLWEADFAAFGVEQHKDGHWNSILWIETPTPATQAA